MYDSDFEYLIEVLKKSFQISCPLIIWYQDEENDLVRISSDMELTEAIRINFNQLRVHLAPDFSLKPNSFPHAKCDSYKERTLGSRSKCVSSDHEHMIDYPQDLCFPRGKNNSYASHSLVGIENPRAPIPPALCFQWKNSFVPLSRVFLKFNFCSKCAINIIDSHNHIVQYSQNHTVQYSQNHIVDYPHNHIVHYSHNHLDQAITIDLDTSNEDQEKDYHSYLQVISTEIFSEQEKVDQQEELVGGTALRQQEGEYNFVTERNDLKKLEEMGFLQRELNISLLVKHKGNVVEVVRELLILEMRSLSIKSS